jgi:hypothetical protein
MLVVAKDLQTRRNKASVAATFTSRMADSGNFLFRAKYGAFPVIS